MIPRVSMPIHVLLFSIIRVLNTKHSICVTGKNGTWSHGTRVKVASHARIGRPNNAIVINIF